MLGNIADKAIAAKDTTQQTAQAAVDKTKETAQAGLEVAQEKVGQVKEKGLEVGQSVTKTAESGKDTTGGFLQQTGETIKGVALGATEVVKNTFGIGQTDEDKKP